MTEGEFHDSLDTYGEYVWWGAAVLLIAPVMLLLMLLVSPLALIGWLLGRLRKEVMPREMRMHNRKRV